jgi:hypothetical protein
VQKLAEELVIAAPVTTTVKGHHQEVAAVELVEHLIRAGGAESGVAQRAAQPLEHRGAGQKRHFGP